jgi:hypothetical protein
MADKQIVMEKCLIKCSVVKLTLSVIKKNWSIIELRVSEGGTRIYEDNIVPWLNDLLSKSQQLVPSAMYYVHT